MVEEDLHLEDWAPSTEAERKAVYGQLDQMLKSPLFRNSKRYPIFLRYLVEQALTGNEAVLKERLLGVTVFHRSPDYDTNQDTVVRLTAGEVRKRIAQYYHQPEHAGQLQIDLRPGSYVPVFRRPEAHSPAQIQPEQQELGIPAQAAKSAAGRDAVPGSGGRAGLAKWLVAVAVLAVLVSVTLWWVFGRAAQAADRQLWAPILDEPGQVQLVIADLSASLNNRRDFQGTQANALFDLLRMGELVNYRDSLAQTDLVAFLARHNKSYRLELSSQASYPDMQRSASVLVGGLDNVWTMRVTDLLRYHFVRRGASYTYAIEDRQHPELGGWNVDLTQPSERSTEDYAIVARIFDQTTGRPVLVVAGIGANGTAAAGQFLLDPERIAELTPHAPRNWQRLNMEAVIRTQTLDNHPGPPHLVDCYFW